MVLNQEIRTSPDRISGRPSPDNKADTIDENGKGYFPEGNPEKAIKPSEANR